MFGVPKKYIKEIDPRAREVYNIFVKKAGAQHIASPIGLHSLLKICDEIKPKRILEVGGGIGTISLLLFKHTNAHVDIFEYNSFCIEELKKNVSDYENRYNLITDYKNYELSSDSYDIIVVDGGSSEFLIELLNRLSSTKRIFVEGNRGERRKVMRRELKKRYIFSLQEYKDAHKKHKGAHEIICRPSSDPLVRFFMYWYWEIRTFKEIRLFFEHRTKLFFQKLGLKNLKKK